MSLAVSTIAVRVVVVLEPYPALRAADPPSASVLLCVQPRLSAEALLLHSHLPGASHAPRLGPLAG